MLIYKEREELQKSHKKSKNFIERSRSFQLLLSDRKNSMADMSRITKIYLQAVVRFFNAWDSASAESKLSTLLIAYGRGTTVKFEQVRDKLLAMVEKHS